MKLSLTVRALACAPLLGGLAIAAVFHPTLPAPVPATGGRVYVTIPRHDLHAYAAVATEVVHARVTGIAESHPSGRIARTAYTLEVLGAVKGLAHGEIVVGVAGTTSGPNPLVVVGAPTFKLGEEAVLFLKTEPSTGETGILGLDQGVYRVTRDAAGSARLRGLHARGETPLEFLGRVGDLAVLPRQPVQGGR